VQREAASKKINVEMNEQTLRQLLNEFSERNEAARKEDRDYLQQFSERNEAARKEDRDYLRQGIDRATLGIDGISKDIKGIKDNVNNLKRRMSDTENEIGKIKENGITREELSEIQRKKPEVIIFGLPELENDLKTAVLDKLNKVTPTSMEEIKFIRKIGKASNGKIQPTLVVFRSTAKREIVLEGAHKVSYSIEPSLTKNQLMYKKKLKEQVNEKNSEAGGRVCKIAGPSDAPVIVTIKKNQIEIVYGK
jgi:hypothetical protein